MQKELNQNNSDINKDNESTSLIIQFKFDDFIDILNFEFSGSDSADLYDLINKSNILANNITDVANRIVAIYKNERISLVRYDFKLDDMKNPNKILRSTTYFPKV